MIFTSIDFLVFFPLLVLMLWLLKSNRSKKIVLILGGYIFYGYWDWRFLLLLFFSTMVNFLIGHRISQSLKSNKKCWLTIGITFNLLILGFFKYYNFFIESANDVLSIFGIRLGILEIILPIGISFFTFEVISYLVDLYKGKLDKKVTIINFTLFMTFFPRIISGPIIRPADFLPQLEKDINIKWENIKHGGQLFLVGVIKKILIADRLAFFIDPVFANPHLYDGWTIAMAVVAYSIQIFCDFSGYTDMAIGIAYMLGFYLPPNFNMPYIAENITDFWKRWHISLSSWLKDYLYIPLGGNKKGRVRTYINLLLTMLIGGLWHGASWNFVLWGGMHGLALCLHKAYEKLTKGMRIKKYFLYRLFAWLSTYTFVCFCWIFFRSRNFETSVMIVKKIITIDSIGVQWIYLPFIVVCALVVVAHIIRIQFKDLRLELDFKSFISYYILFLVFILIIILMPKSSAPFVYFQF